MKLSEKGLGDLLFDCEEVRRLPPPRCSSADPIFLACRLIGEQKWRLVPWWCFNPNIPARIGKETYDSLNEIMLVLARSFSEPMELKSPYLELWLAQK